MDNNSWVSWPFVSALLSLLFWISFHRSMLTRLRKPRRYRARSLSSTTSKRDMLDIVSFGLQDMQAHQPTRYRLSGSNIWKEFPEALFLHVAPRASFPLFLAGYQNELEAQPRHVASDCVAKGVKCQEGLCLWAAKEQNWGPHV